MSDEFDAMVSAAQLLNRCRSAALATLDDDGAPFASLVSVAAETGRFPILLLSDLAVHTRNIQSRPQASLLFVEGAAGAADPLVRERLTLVGQVRRCKDQSAASATFLDDHPYAAAYAGFADFAFYRLICTGAHLVAGFGRIARLDVEQVFPQRDG